MVTVTNALKRKAADGREFVVLELSSGLEMVQSQSTGRFYATARKCTISSTFTEEVAKSLIGSQIPGRIDRVSFGSYEYAIPSTGEIITLAHRWSYVPESAISTTVSHQMIAV